MNAGQLQQYWNTLRFLRPVQFYGRLWFRLAWPRIDFSPAPPLRPVAERHWVLPARRELSLLAPECFCFLNEPRDLAVHGWDDPTVEKLWRYNLHYFDDLNAQNAGERGEWHQNLLSRWVRENPPGAGTGWEPYPTSLRIVNWVKWALAGNNLPPECLHSLAIQSRWLGGRLEIHLLGNHLFANAKALVFAGLFFDGPEAARWLEKGLLILDREIPEQILADGGQFERSTMYHALALEDMLDLCNVAATFSDALPTHWQSSVTAWRSRTALMLDWLAAMCHPDGEISLFNDAAIGIAPAPAELERYARELGFSAHVALTRDVINLAPSGYIRVERGSAVTIMDVAPVGPDYLPGHAHADTLSFEFSLFGIRILVNSGTSCYGESVERQRQRSTAAHNTVVVDGQNSSEVWSSFRVARRAYPSSPVILNHGEQIVITCSHSGYQRLPGKNTHHRKWILERNSMLIEDRIDGRFKSAESRFHLHPDVKIDTQFLHQGHAVLLLKNGERIDFVVEEGALFTEASSWHPRFGHSVPTTCLAIRFLSSVAKSRINW